MLRLRAQNYAALGFDSKAMEDLTELKSIGRPDMALLAVTIILDSEMTNKESEYYDKFVSLKKQLTTDLPPQENQ